MTAPYDHVIAANSWLFDIIAQRTIRERIAAEFRVPRHMVRLAALDVLFALRENPSKEEWVRLVRAEVRSRVSARKSCDC